MRTKITVELLLLALTSTIHCASAWAAEKPAKLLTVRIAVVSRGTLDLPFWVARERGFFRDEGVDAEIILFKASLTVQGMLGGSIDFGTATGADVRIVMAMSERPSFDLMGHARIANVQQLGGKKIGYGGVGGLPEIIIRQILAVNQIPTDQVTFLALGGGDVSYMSLRAGVIDAVMLQFPTLFSPRTRASAKSLQAPITIAPSKAA